MKPNRAVAVQKLYAQYFKVACIFLITHCSMYTNSACIIIHGTWAQNETWCRPWGDFFEAIKSCNNEIKIVDEIVSFSWSGKLGYPAQLQAAQNLVKIIELYDFVILVTHSHGATVGMIAAEIIFATSTNGNNFGKVAKFYALGAPVDQSVATPNMHVIKKFYNLFSFGDFVQTVNGTCGRTFFEHNRVANISIQFNNAHPSHAQLHHPAFGIWLLKIEDFFAQNNIGNFQNFNLAKPGVIFFGNYQHPVYDLQNDQSVLLELDKKIHEWTTTVFFRGGKKLESDDSKM